LIRLFDLAGSRHGRRATFGAVALASVVAVAGCGGSSSASTGSSSGSGTSQTSALSKCLEEHGVTPPQGAGGGGFGGGGSGATPHARPTGSAASSFRQALQACGGSAGFHGGSAG
jgi:hypothetical protein